LVAGAPEVEAAEGLEDRCLLGLTGRSVVAEDGDAVSEKDERQLGRMDDGLAVGDRDGCGGVGVAEGHLLGRGDSGIGVGEGERGNSDGMVEGRQLGRRNVGVDVGEDEDGDGVDMAVGRMLGRSDGIAVEGVVVDNVAGCAEGTSIGFVIGIAEWSAVGE
jgi:hypothetical protein